MLNDTKILEILNSNKKTVAMDIVTDFTDTTNEARLNKTIFQSQLMPVAPALCFFEESSEYENYRLSSFFDLKEPQYKLVPFGNINSLSDEELEGIGMRYNSFCNLLPLNSHVLCNKATNVVDRIKNQVQYFAEYNLKYENAESAWSAGHLIPHQYTPPYSSDNKAATRQLLLNFIPEPYKWNCHQRNHLESACSKYTNYFGVYPVYTLRYQYGRTTTACRNSPNNLPPMPYRPLPDGEFFIGDLSKNCRTKTIYIPFLAPNLKLHDTKVYNKEGYTNKIDKAVAEYKVNLDACPDTTIFALNGNLEQLARKMKNESINNASLALGQGSLFPDNQNIALHQTAVIRLERAAVREVGTIKNKMHSALTFSALGNIPRTNKYIKAIKQHATILLDECEAGPRDKLFSYRLYKDFCNTFPEHDAALEVMQRLAAKY